MQNDAQKYEILYQRDKEMTDFINNFEATRQSVLHILKEQSEILDVQQRITEELESISKKVGLIGALPSKEDFLELQKEFTFKVILAFLLIMQVRPDRELRKHVVDAQGRVRQA